MKIEFPLPASLNEYSDAERRHRQIGARMKHDETMDAYVACLSQIQEKALRVEKYPIRLHFHWYCPNRKKDPDNISFAKKFLLDGMVCAGLIPNDGWKHIGGFDGDDFTVDKENPRVIVTISW